MTKDTVPSKPLALALLALAQFMIILDASIVNVAIPSIQKALNFSPEDLSWVVNAYALMFGGFLLLGGRLADLIGRRRVFIAGMTLFGIASLLGGFSNSELQLILCRGAQGLGAALVSPAALSTISVIFAAGSERNRAFGVWGAVGGSGGAMGVFLGGVLTQWLGWEWILFINVPFALGAALLAPRLLVESRDPGHQSYDIPGAITVTAGLMAIVYAIVDADTAGWGSTQTVGLLAAGVGLIALFVLIELRTKEPLISFSIFNLKTLRAANIIAFVNTMAVPTTFFAYSIYTQQVLGHSAIYAGTSLVPLSVASIVFAGVASNLITRIGFKPVLIAGTALMTVALLWLSQISPDSSFLTDILPPTVIFGAGIGMTFVAVTIGALTGTDDTNAGLGSGLLNTNQQIGAALGLAVLISVYTTKTADEISAGVNRATALSEGLSQGILVGAGFCVISLVLAIFMVSTRDSRANVEASKNGALDARLV